MTDDPNGHDIDPDLDALGDSDDPMRQCDGCEGWVPRAAGHACLDCEAWFCLPCFADHLQDEHGDA